MLHFQIFRTLNNKCESEWKKLEKQSYYNFFQSYNYIKEIIDNNNKKNIYIIIIYNKNEAIALFPLEVKKYFIFKILQWIGTKKSDYCNPIISNNFYNNIDKKIFLTLWKDILNKIDNFDLYYFNNQLIKIEESENPFVKFFDAKIFSKIFQIQLPETFDKYKRKIKEKDKKYFYEIHRTLIKLDNLKKIYPVEFYANKLNSKDLKLKNLVKDKIQQLKNENKKSNLDQDFIKIYENLSILNNDNYFITQLKIDGKIVAECFGIIYKDTFYYFIPLLLPNEYSNFKIGKILILKIIEWCIYKKLKKFDFGLGSESYKKYFSNISIPMYRHNDYRGIKGFFLFIFLRLFFFFKL